MDYWLQQTVEQPLFEQLVWSRPQNRRQAGKLGIIGGHGQSFAVVAGAFQAAARAGAGSIRVLLPDSLRQLVGPVMAEGEFAPANPSGSLAQSALADCLQLASWSDAVLLPGDLGRNSETAILLEKFAAKYQGQLTITKDAADYYTTAPALILSRPDTVLVASIAQLQRLFAASRQPQAIAFGMDLLQLVAILHRFSRENRLTVIVKHHQNIVVAVNGQVSTTRLAEDKRIWRTEQAARSAVWLMQNPEKAFEALTTSVVDG